MSLGSGTYFSDLLINQQEADEAARILIEAQQTAVHNEQTKLLASLLNIVAAGLIVTGIIAPLTNAGTTLNPTTAITNQSFAVMAIWSVTAIGLHYLARLVLRNLR